MQSPPSDTFFTASAHWGWVITFYFFFGGIAGCSYFFAAIIDASGARAHAGLARLGYLIALPALLLCPPLLIVDLNRPERFWHLFVKSKVLTPIFKGWSPISFGSWALLIFGGFVAVSFAAALGEGKSRGIFARLAGLRPTLAGRVFAAIGGLFGLLIAGYTGMLISVTNRPIWADTPLFGALFMLSAAATSAALPLLVGRRAAPASLEWIAGMEVKAALLELLTLAALLISLGPVARVWLGIRGVLLGSMVIVGILIPLLLHARPRLLGARSGVTAAGLVLLGGLALRAIMILGSESL